MALISLTQNRTILMHEFRYDYDERLKRQNPQILLPGFGLKKEMKILDLGCNDGFYANFALDIIGPNGLYVGVDINQSALDNLKASLESKRILNFKLYHSSAEDFLLKDFNFDFVLMATVLHDFKDPGLVLDNIYRMSNHRSIIVDYDFRSDKIGSFGPPASIRFSLEKASNLLVDHKFAIKDANNLDDIYYLIKASKS